MMSSMSQTVCSDPFLSSGHTVFATGEQLKAKTSRIVAGQECDKTNEFLQAVATAVLRKTDSTEAVQKVLSGTKPSDKRKATKLAMSQCCTTVITSHVCNYTYDKSNPTYNAIYIYVSN